MAASPMVARRVPRHVARHLAQLFRRHLADNRADERCSEVVRTATAVGVPQAGKGSGATAAGGGTVVFAARLLVVTRAVEAMGAQALAPTYVRVDRRGPILLTAVWALLPVGKRRWTGIALQLTKHVLRLDFSACTAPFDVNGK